MMFDREVIACVVRRWAGDVVAVPISETNIQQLADKLVTELEEDYEYRQQMQYLDQMDFLRRRAAEASPDDDFGRCFR